MPAVDLPKEYLEHLNRQGFLLQDVLGQGLSGSVFVALQPSLNRRVAVKFFDSAFIRNDAAMRKRFSREARILAKFQHQGIPYVLTQGAIKASHGDTPYFVMEFIEGETLRAILNKEGSLSLEKVLSYARQVLDALGYAHARGIVHRDVKPGNIMVDARGRCFLIDFSIGVNLIPEPGFTRATLAKDALGTAAYMAPEQMNNPADITSRADIYALGAVLFEMLSGQTDRTNVRRALGHFPHRVISAIEMACATSPEERFQSAEDFARALGGQVLTPILQPTLAICSNKKCEGADWSPNGYYRGPRLIEESTDSFCTACGDSLKYHCNACGAPIVNAPHCGNCGQKNFTVPTCKKCGSFLKLLDMDADTTDGCSKCSAKKTVAPSFADMDDDIPF